MRGLKSIWIMLAALDLLLPAQGAAAQACRDDGECAAGERCDKPVSVPGCETPPDCPDPEPVEDEVGSCVDEDLFAECAQDADCGDALVCIRSVSFADCGEGEECSSDPIESETGFCDLPPPEPLACDDALSCPPPLTCDTSGEQPLCSWEQLTCEAASDCPESFECIDAELIGGGCMECVDGEEGIECRSVSCAEQGVADQCEPARIACSDDAECPAQWRCVAYAGNVLPGHWAEVSQDELGCVPEGTIALAEGRVHWGAVTLADGAASSSHTDEATPVGAPEDDGAAMKSSSGCSVQSGAGGSESGAGAWLALLGVAFLARRRRAA